MKDPLDVLWHTLFTSVPPAVILGFGYPYAAFFVALLLSLVIVVREKLQKDRCWRDLIDRDQVFYEWFIPLCVSMLLTIEGIIAHAK